MVKHQREETLGIGQQQREHMQTLMFEGLMEDLVILQSLVFSSYVRAAALLFC